MATKDWVAWHLGYEEPASPLSWRLRQIQRRIAETLNEAPSGMIRIASLCAGDGRDLLEVLGRHPRAKDVAGVLVEQDPALAERARRRAASLPAHIRVVTGDASRTSIYVDFVPVDLLLLCGIFGNIPDDDIARTINHLPGFCRAGTTVIWTRHRRPPDVVPSVRHWFLSAGFTEVFLDSLNDCGPCVGRNRYIGPKGPCRLTSSSFSSARPADGISG